MTPLTIGGLITLVVLIVMVAGIKRVGRRTTDKVSEDWLRDHRGKNHD